jgi:DNA modification methylase
MSYQIIHGEALEVLRTMPDESVHCCVTSPPYWGLRDYGVPGQLGLEPTPDEYVARLVEVFREVRRVLRDDGTLWLNLGDSYARTQETNVSQSKNKPVAFPFHAKAGSSDGAVGRGDRPGGRAAMVGLKPKDLVGIPWMVAFALRADGWYLRSDIIWAKPNPMPESVRDRPTKSHEYIFLLSKSARYFYDAEAIAEQAAYPVEETRNVSGLYQKDSGRNDGSEHRSGGFVNGAARNKRDVWTVTTKPYTEAHFATFPPDLIEPCVLAGTSERGCCAECGAPWERALERVPGDAETESRPKKTRGMGSETSTLSLSGNGSQEWMRRGTKVETLCWRAMCDHESEPVPCTVLDPFAGAGTTGVVALRAGRAFIGIELNAGYVEMSRNRIHGDAPLLNQEVASP